VTITFVTRLGVPVFLWDAEVMKHVK